MLKLGVFILVMFFDLVDMATLEVHLVVEVMLWIVLLRYFEKLIMHVLNSLKK